MTHVLEGDLMRWLDGEADAPLIASLTAHVATCAECRVRLDHLRGYAERWRQVVSALDRPVTTRQPRRTRQWAWAAGVTVLLGAGVMVEPLRAWIVERGRDLWSLVAGHAPASEPAVAPSVPSRIEFQPGPGLFAITVAEWQATGRLIIEVGPPGSALAWVEGGEADLLVLPTGLRVVNQPTASATYRLVVPPDVATRVVVGIGSGAVEPVTLVPGQAWERPLGRTGPGGSLP